jgi:hypothetical protein
MLMYMTFFNWFLTSHQKNIKRHYRVLLCFIVRNPIPAVFILGAGSACKKKSDPGQSGTTQAIPRSSPIEIVGDEVTSL